MNHNINLNGSLMIAALSLTLSVIGLNRAEIVNDSNEITWLGLDFSQVKFIGTAYQFKDAGEISNAEFIDKYARVGINFL